MNLNMKKLPRRKKPKFKGCSLDQFKRHCLKNNGIGYMYVILCTSEDESFIKVGITSNIDNRLKSIPYSCSILKLVSGNYSYIYHKEQNIHTSLKSQRYIPKKRFGGRYECYPLAAKDMLV